jgi:hypothetical protein
VTAFVSAQFNAAASAWFDIGRVELLDAAAPVKAAIRVYALTESLVVGIPSVVVQPGVPYSHVLGGLTNVFRGFIVEATPLESPIGDGAVMTWVAEDQSVGSGWHHVIRIDSVGASAPVLTALRIYGVRDLPIVTELRTTLEPGVLHKFALGSSAANRGYVIKLSPVDALVGTGRITSSVQPEFDGVAWNDVARVQLFETATPVSVDVRVWAVGVVPMWSVGRSQFIVRAAAVTADRAIMNAAFIEPFGYDPSGQPVTVTLANGACGGVFSRFSVPAGSFAAYQGGAIVQFQGSVTDEVTGAELRTRMRLVRQRDDAVGLRIDIWNANFSCLRGADSRAIETMVTVGDSDILGQSEYRRLNGGRLLFP